MKKSTLQFTLMAFLLSLIIWSCAKEKTMAPNGPILASDFTSLTLDDNFDLPNPALSERLAHQLFDLKENDGKLTHSEVVSIGDPANNKDLVYALLFVEEYGRSEILWSWDEPAEEEDDVLDERSTYGKWRWTGGDPIGSFWCSGFKKWPTQKVKNRFTDPCGEVLENGAIYKCGYSLCDGDLPTELQPNCNNPVITIPAGSVDALAQAIEDVCPNGTIILANGEHIENNGVVINKRVTIKGENGAVLKIHAELNNDPLIPIEVGLHFLDVDRAKLENLTIEALNGVAGTGVLLQGSDKASIRDCHFNNFQNTILIEESDKVSITGNTIVCSDGWLSGVFGSALGITIINGEKANIADNEVSFGLFGVWACDKDGIYKNNYTHHNYIGFILCKVPGEVTLPNGNLTGAEFSATRWKCTNNTSTDNFDAGYMVIDGANNNSLKNNAGGNNATYDFDLVGDSQRFGFFTPTGFNNTVNMGSYSGLTVKDCGEGNQVIGNAVIIDTGSDPCF